MTASKPKTAAELVEMFIASAEERGRVEVQAWSRFIWLSERQADWLIGLREKELTKEFGPSRKDYIYGYIRSLTIGDRQVIWSDKARNGCLRVEYHSLTEREAFMKEDRARRDRELAEWDREPGIDSTSA